MEYRYPHFERELLVEEMDFAGGPGIGQELPDFTLATTQDGHVRKRDFAGRPLLILFASIT
ncbi:MAG: hypothetical protein HYY16_06075 [Planctomycetes bacterium]|nr:hypothetical protein [Planctomycetota bacterium]